jgi:hypothetical protein
MRYNDSDLKPLSDGNVRAAKAKVAAVVSELGRLDALLPSISPGHRIGVALALDAVFHELRGFVAGLTITHTPPVPGSPHPGVQAPTPPGHKQLAAADSGPPA